MITWNLTEQQADQVLNALGHRPFIEVQGLIGELIKQANPPKLTGPQEPMFTKANTPMPNGLAEGPGGPLGAVPQA